MPEKEPPEKSTPDTTEIDIMPPLKDEQDNPQQGAIRKQFFGKKDNRPQA